MFLCVTAYDELLFGTEFGAAVVDVYFRALGGLFGASCCIVDNFMRVIL